MVGQHALQSLYLLRQGLMCLDQGVERSGQSIGGRPSLAGGLCLYLLAALQCLKLQVLGGSFPLRRFTWF